MALSENNVSDRKVYVTINTKHYTLNDMTVDQLHSVLTNHYGIHLSSSNRDDYINAIIKRYFKKAVDINDKYKQVLINSKTYDELMDILEECFGYTFEKIKNCNINTTQDCKRAIFIELNPYPTTQQHLVVDLCVKGEDTISFTPEESEQIEYYVKNFTLEELHTKLRKEYDYNDEFVIIHFTSKETAAQEIVLQERLKNEKKQDDDDCCLDYCECHFWCFYGMGHRRHHYYHNHNQSSNNDNDNKFHDNNHDGEHCTGDICNCNCCESCHGCNCYLNKCTVGDLFNFQCNLGECSSNSLDLCDFLSKVTGNVDISDNEAGTCIGGCMCGFVVGFFTFLVLLVKALVGLEFELILDGFSCVDRTHHCRNYGKLFISTNNML